MPEIFLPRIASHTIRGFFCARKRRRGRMAAPGSTPVGQKSRPLCHWRQRTITDSNGQKQTPPIGAARDGVWCGGWRMAMVGSTPVGQERRPLSHRRKRTITDSNGQKRTPLIGVARDGVGCGWLAECDGWQYACRAGEQTLESPKK